MMVGSDTGRPRQLLGPRFGLASATPPPTLSAVQGRRRTELLQRLADGAYRLLPDECPCGNAGDGVVISEVDRYGLPLTSVLCMACGTVSIDPYLDGEGLEHFYRHVYRELYGRAIDPEAYFHRQMRVGEKLLASLDWLPTEARVWDVGCGAGGALRAFREHGHRTLGNDLDETLLEVGRRKDVGELCLGDVDSVAAAHPHLRFDLIVLHHVLEHVGRPVELLSALGSRLAPRGRIVVVVPDLSRIDSHVVPAGDALGFFHIAHKYNYSRTGLGRMARRASLRASALEPVRNWPTAWSRAPETWIELSADGSPALAAEDGPASEPAGERMLRYLRRTESLRRLGLCRGQWRRLAERVAVRRLAAAARGLRLAAGGQPARGTE